MEGNEERGESQENRRELARWGAQEEGQKRGA